MSKSTNETKEERKRMAPRKRNKKTETVNTDVIEDGFEDEFSQAIEETLNKEKEANPNPNKGKKRNKMDLTDLFGSITIQDENAAPESAVVVKRGRERTPTPFDDALLQSYLSWKETGEEDWKSVVIPTEHVDKVRTVLGQVATWLSNTTEYQVGSDTAFEPFDTHNTKLWFRGKDRTKRTRKPGEENDTNEENQTEDE